MDVDIDSSPEYEDISEQKSPELKKRGPKKKKKKSLMEPQKPVSAYALFFRDTQAAIKAENSMATFGEISKIVASMWDSLSEEAKQVYKQKTEAAKREYLKQLAAYRASCAAKDDVEEDESTPLVYLKEKMTDKRISPTLSNSVLPPPPKLQMAPAAVTKDVSRPSASISPPASKSSSVSVQNNGVSSHSPSTQSTIPQTSSAGPSPVNPPPIQLRSIVPKAQGPITILQSKPGQIIKLIPASQATCITNRSDGSKTRILKMTDLIRHDNPSSPDQIPATNDSDVQPILQTLEQESGTLQSNPVLEHNGKKTNGIDNQTGEVIIIDETDSQDDVQSSEETPMETNSNYRTPNVRVCVRDGCPNLAVSDPQWDDEYCSAFCAVEHCRDVFDAWVSVRQVNASAS